MTSEPTTAADQTREAKQRGLPAATTFAVLAQCWHEPTAALVAAINDGHLDDIAPGVDAVTLQDLRVEHARLFVGFGDLPAPPYESVYRDRDGDEELGPVLGPSTTAVQHWYRTYGVDLSATWSDLPDHVATELEFAAHLSATEGDAVCDQFLAEHLRAWVDEFFDRVAAAAREPFYQELAETTRALLTTHD